MRIKVGETWYDKNNADILMVELTDKDKENIANMLPECTKYCEFKPDVFSEDEVNEFMELSPERIKLVDEKSKITDTHR